MSTALIRCYALDVEVEAPGDRFAKVYPALELNKLVHIRSDLTNSRGRSRGNLYKPTDRGLIVLTADEPRLLAVRGGDEDDPGYTARLSEAVWDEPEAVDRSTQKRISDRGRLHDSIRDQSRSGHLLHQWTQVQAELHEVIESANALGLDLRSDIRTIRARLNAVETKIRERAA